MKDDVYEVIKHNIMLLTTKWVRFIWQHEFEKKVIGKFWFLAIGNKVGLVSSNKIISKLFSVQKKFLIKNLILNENLIQQCIADKEIYRIMMKFDFGIGSPSE